MCGLWKQKVVTTGRAQGELWLPSGCACLGWAVPGACGIPLHFITSQACMPWGHCSHSPSAGDTPGLGPGSDSGMKALVGARVGTISPE